MIGTDEVSTNDLIVQEENFILEFFTNKQWMLQVKNVGVILMNIDEIFIYG